MQCQKSMMRAHRIGRPTLCSNKVGMAEKYTRRGVNCSVIDHICGEVIHYLFLKGLKVQFKVCVYRLTDTRKINVQRLTLQLDALKLWTIYSYDNLPTILQSRQTMSNLMRSVASVSLPSTRLCHGRTCSLTHRPFA